MKMTNKITWIEEYKCGCSTESPRKRDLLGYCSKHGDSRKRLHKMNETKITETIKKILNDNAEMFWKVRNHQ